MRVGFVGFNRLELDALMSGLKFRASHVLALDLALPAEVVLDALLLSDAAWRVWAGTAGGLAQPVLRDLPWVVLSGQPAPTPPAEAHGVQPHRVGIGLGAADPLEEVQRWLSQRLDTTGKRWGYRPERPRTALTEREHEVLALLCRGMSNDEISTALGIKVSTVKTYLQRIFERTGAVNRAHAVALYADSHPAGSTSKP